MRSVLLYISPWEFSPTVCLVCVVSAVLYARGLIARRARGVPTGFWKPLSFFAGLALDYAVLQTYVDFLSQHMFWIHRLQHLVLHHVAAVLIVLASPGHAMLEGVPAPWRERLARLPNVRRALAWLLALERLSLRIIQNPVVAPLLFVGLIYYWLVPSVHFAAMLDIDLYRAMNWGMAVDGILFWWLMLAPHRDQGCAAIGYPWRILIVFLVAFPQILIGAYICLDHGLIYNVYAICGRAWNINPLTDQQIGGLLTWIPAAMMSVIAMLIILRRMLAEEAGTDSAPAPLTPATHRSP
jgi:putative membrane protein